MHEPALLQRLFLLVQVQVLERPVGLGVGRDALRFEELLCSGDVAA